MLNISPLPIISTLLAITYAILLLAYPPHRSSTRKLSILLLVIPVAIAFEIHNDLYPDPILCNMFARFLLIWVAHMSHLVCIVEYNPIKNNANDSGFRERFNEAWKMVFDYDFHEPSESGETDTPKHPYSRAFFLLHHLNKAVLLYFSMSAFETFTWEYVPFIRRNISSALFASLYLPTLYNHFIIAFDWCVIKMFLFEVYHSVFALLFVGLGLNTHDTWSLSLFGSIQDAWSVRRYWGKYWHKYVYFSFSAHVKIVTRNWLGLPKRSMFTRLLENTMVFAVSGLMHSLVSYVQYSGRREIWYVTIWYTAQMLPIVIETMVQGGWTKLLRRTNINKTSRRMQIFERSVGYLWVLSWFMWSIPLYLKMRNERSFQMLQQQIEAAKCLTTAAT